jgi:two-component system sensor histidine kinase HydH
MIIKASLHTLGQSGASPTAIDEAVADIDEEVARLNRIVNEVLDFAQPIRFELAPTDVNALCRDSVAASEKGAPGVSVHLDLDPHLPMATTDAERLRIALVNMLVNARHAANGQGGGVDMPPVTLKTEANHDRAAITISDRGAGIDVRDLPHVFDPYFTTKRGGTGLGLPIAKNIVEGLGGAITVSSVLGRGTNIRVEIPFSPAIS